MHPADLHPAVSKLLTRTQWAQRTPEWYEVRKGLVTASDAAAILGIPPFPSFKGDPRKETMQKKLTSAPLRSMAAVHGVKYEQEACDMAMRALGETAIEFGLLVHQDLTWLAASPDGVTTRGFAIEIKCPTKRRIEPGHIPHHYYPQVQVQMEVCDLPATYFIQYKPGFLTHDGQPFVDITIVERDRVWFRDNVASLREFWREYTDARAAMDPGEPPAADDGGGCLIRDDLY
jgi:hypothetical protein